MTDCKVCPAKLGEEHWPGCDFTGLFTGEPDGAARNYPVLVPHPAAELFPLLGWAALKELADDIKVSGQRDPILLWHGQILDGRNRLRACRFAHVEPRFLDRSDIADPVAFVVSVNLKRRHLSPSQASMVAARAAILFRAEAKARQHAGRPAAIADKGNSADKAAKALNVSGASVERAEKVRKKGTPELVAAVDADVIAVSRAAQIAELPADEQRKIIASADPKLVIEAGKKIRAVKEEKRRGERVEKIRRQSEGNGPLMAPTLASVVYADPPWRYEAGTTDPSREIENQYPTMSLDEICAMPVAARCTEDAILFLWHPPGMATFAVRVAEAWGFTERSGRIWRKPSIGPGYWTRQQHECLMIATRGKIPAPPVEARFPSVVDAPRGEHSAKPAIFAEQIEAAFPLLSKLELFCRSPRSGWMVFGNESAGKLATG